MTNLQNFIELLKDNNYIIIEYFSYGGVCNMVKIIHSLSGCIFFITISKMYNVIIEGELVNHYNLNDETMPFKEPSSQQLSEYYPNIQLTHNEDEIIDDISNKLKASYKQPIVVPKHSDMEYIHQMERLKYCFKLLDVKLILQTNQYLIQLTNDNLI